MPRAGLCRMDPGQQQVKSYPLPDPDRAFVLQAAWRPVESPRPGIAIPGQSLDVPDRCDCGKSNPYTTRSLTRLVAQDLFQSQSKPARPLQQMAPDSTSGAVNSAFSGCARTNFRSDSKAGFERLKCNGPQVLSPACASTRSGNAFPTTSHSSAVFSGDFAPCNLDAADLASFRSGDFRIRASSVIPAGPP